MCPSSSAHLTSRNEGAAANFTRLPPPPSCSMFLTSVLSASQDNWYREASRLSTYLVSPIHDAAAKGNVQGLEELIVNQHQNVDSRDHAQNTPLHYSAGAGYVDAVAWLLAHGADINALNLLGDTPLHRVRLASVMSTIPRVLSQ